MAQVEINDLLLQAMFPTDPAILEYTNLLLGGTLDLSMVVREIENKFVKGDDGRRKDITITYEEWRAIRQSLAISSAFMGEQLKKVNMMKKKLEEFNELAELKIQPKDD